MAKKNKEEKNAYLREWKRKNREKYNAKELERYHKNKVLKPVLKLTDEQLKKNKSEQDKRYRERNASKIKENKRKYYLENKEEVHRKTREKFKNDTAFRIRHSLRTRLNSAIRGRLKAGSAVKDLGCSIEEFKNYIASKFLEGMSWENHGEWHLDHIKPLSSFDLENREQFLIAAHYTNYQPLWAIDNLKKNKYIR